MLMENQQQSLWRHLPLLLQSSSWESVEYVLKSLWRTRRTGLDDADRKIICQLLDLPSNSDLDPLLVCLRILIRRCVYEDISKDEIHKVFPEGVLPELQRCLTSLLLKFQPEWRQDAYKEKVSLPRLKAMTWDLVNQDVDNGDPIAIINLKLQDESRSLAGDTEVKFQLTKDTVGTMLKSLRFMRDQLSNTDDGSNVPEQQPEAGTM